MGRPDSRSRFGGDCNDIRWESEAECRHCAIRGQALFAALRGPDFEHLLVPIRRAPIPAGTELYREGAAAHAIYTVRGGLLKLVKDAPGGGRIVRLLGPGATTGMEALSTGLYWHTAVAARPSDLCRIPLDVFGDLREHHAPLADRLMAQWERQVQSADRWLAELNQGTVADRVQRLLLMLAEIEGARIELPPMADLASILGTTRESVSRALAELKRAHALRRVAPRTYECDPEVLSC
jgi:CRP-like cAMP-binding protein